MDTLDGLNSNSFVLSNFSQGMHYDRQHALQEGEYILLINGRIRNGEIEPVNLPLEASGLPSGNFQGIFSFGPSLVVMISGVPYIRDYSQTGSSYRRIDNIDMDKNAQFIYGVLVPESANDYERVSSNGKPKGTITLEDSTNGTPSGLILQDEYSQPRLISSSGEVRITQTFEQWKKGAREYVPRGGPMLYHDGILYIVSRMGKKIYRSLTNRPLDFVIAVTNTGGKITDGAFDIVR